jgi:hypothetical protein
MAWHTLPSIVFTQQVLNTGYESHCTKLMSCVSFVITCLTSKLDSSLFNWYTYFRHTLMHSINHRRSLAHVNLFLFTRNPKLASSKYLARTLVEGYYLFQIPVIIPNASIVTWITRGNVLVLTSIQYHQFK